MEKYKILSNRSAEHLEKEVNLYLSKGWVTVGTLIYGQKEIHPSDSSNRIQEIPMFYQPIITNKIEE